MTHKVKEDPRTEFMSILNDKLEKLVVAFLNSYTGGEIYIGIAYDGAVLGVDEYEKALHIINERIKNNISPNCLGLYDVHSEEIKGKFVIHIVISRGTEKPYFIKLFGLVPAGCFIWLDGEIKQLDSKMIETVTASRTLGSLKDIVSPKSDTHTFTQLKIYYEERGFHINEAFLEKLDLYTQEGRFNYIAYLLTDKNNISMRVAKYSDNDDSEMIQNEEYGMCSLIKATDRILDKLEIENRTYIKITEDNIRHVRRMIDKNALREAFINAVIHNDYTRGATPLVEIYSDRLVIISYGGLVEGLTVHDFLNGRAMPRNKELVRVFKDLGFIEHFGSGVKSVLKFYDKSVYHIGEHSIETVFPFAEEYLVSSGKKTERVVKKGKTRDRIIEMIKRDETVTAEVLAKSIGVTKKAIEWQLKQLREANLIVHIGSRKTGIWKVRV